MNNTDNDNIITLNDEDGNEVRFEFLDLVEYDEAEYVVLLPVENSDEPGEVVILMLAGNEPNGDETYVGVEDEETLSVVFQIFKRKFQDEFDFV